VFDLDDTLISRQEAFRRYSERFYDDRPAMHGTPRTEAVATMVGWDNRGEFSRIEYFGLVKDRWPAVEDVPDLVEHYWPGLAGAVEIDPEITTFLKELSAAGVPWGILTNGPSKMQRSKLRNTRLENLADFAIVPSEFNEQKPSGPAFQTVLQRAGTAAAETLMVGDNPNTDIIGAQNTGMPTAWMRDGRSWRDVGAAIPAPTHEIDTVLELRPYLIG
jgi:putative hydrolase of the HAD superfamily